MNNLEYVRNVLEEKLDEVDWVSSGISKNGGTDGQSSSRIKDSEDEPAEELEEYVELSFEKCARIDQLSSSWRDSKGEDIGEVVMKRKGGSRSASDLSSNVNLETELVGDFEIVQLPLSRCCSY